MEDSSLRMELTEASDSMETSDADAAVFGRNFERRMTPQSRLGSGPASREPVVALTDGTPFDSRYLATN